MSSGDNVIKHFLWACCVTAVGIAFATAISSFAESYTAASMASAGYEQQIVPYTTSEGKPSSKVIWARPKP